MNRMLRLAGRSAAVAAVALWIKEIWAGLTGRTAPPPSEETGASAGSILRSVELAADGVDEALREGRPVVPTEIHEHVRRGQAFEAEFDVGGEG